MSTFTLKIKTDNAAFEDNALETARILRDAAHRIQYSSNTYGYIHDDNGNRVGEWEFREDDK